MGEAAYIARVISKYFNKVQCFCFSKISVGSLAEATLPLVFYIDSKVDAAESAKNIKAITPIQLTAVAVAVASVIMLLFSYV